MFRSITNPFANGFKIPELKSRILFTVTILAVCRLIAFVRIPSLDGAVLTEFFNKSSAGGGLLGMYNLFTGGALEHCAIGSLGIMPYISAAIVIQLLIVVIVAVKKRARQPGHNLPR
jgi:preprotein translocase subunit SecY